MKSFKIGFLHIFYFTNYKDNYSVGCDIHNYSFTKAKFSCKIRENFVPRNFGQCIV